MKPARRPDGSVWPVFGLTLRNQLMSKRTPILLGVLLVPAFVTLVIYAPLQDGTYDSFDGSAVAPGRDGDVWFQDSTIILYYAMFLPLVTAFYATGLIGDEVSAKTLPYLFTRPVRRETLFLAKFAAFLVGTVVVAGVPLLITYVLSTVTTAQPFASADQLLVAFGILVLGVAAFGALFAWMGVAIKFPLVFALGYFVMWENVVGNLPASLKKLTIVFYLRSSFSEYVGRTQYIDQVLMLTVPAWVAVAVPLAVAATFTALATVWIGRKDYHL